MRRGCYQDRSFEDKGKIDYLLDGQSFYVRYYLRWIDMDVPRSVKTRLRIGGDPPSNGSQAQSRSNGEQTDLSHLNPPFL